MSSKAPARSVFWFCDLAFCESVLSHSQLYSPHAGLRHVSKSRSWYCHQQGIYQSLLADRKYLSPNKVNISWFWGHMLLLSSDLSAFHCPWLSQNYVMPIWYFCMKSLCLGFQLPSPFHQAYLCWIQLAKHVLRPWPLQMFDKCLPGLLFLCLALPFHTQVIRVCICLSVLLVTILILRFSFILTQNICHQEIKHWLKTEDKDGLILHSHKIISY